MPVMVESSAHDSGVCRESMAGSIVMAEEERRVDPQLHVREEERQAVNPIAYGGGYYRFESRRDVVQLGQPIRLDGGMEMEVNPRLAHARCEGGGACGDALAVPVDVRLELVLGRNH